MGCFSRFRFTIAALLAAALSSGAASAQIRINEILPDPEGTDTGTERVEIYNAGATAIDVTGWAIDDAATIDEVLARCLLPEDFDTSVCPASALIQPGEFRVVKGTSTAAWINQAGDDIYLISDRTLVPNVVHQVSYTGPAVVGMSWACIPNGSNHFDWRTSNFCATNGGTTGDMTPPATVLDLLAQPGAYPGEILLTWTAPGDDGTSGDASGYTIKVSFAAITAGNFATAIDIDRWIHEGPPRVAGSAESLVVFGLEPDSTYHFALETQDEVPNTSAVSNDAGAQPGAGNPLEADLGDPVFYGNLHSHTSYSDGVQTPAIAFNYARNLAQTPLDFLAVTDHNHVSAGMNYPNYAAGMSQAAAANDDGAFVAIYGQEWGLATNGHLNLLEAPGLFGWDPGQFDWEVAEGDYASLYSAYVAHPPANYPPVALLCHPNPGNFNNLQVTPDALQVVHLMCLVNGPATATSTTESDIGNAGFDPQFNEALFKGFRVSPTADQDNHNATWGASSQSRTAVFAPAKTKSAIMEALAERRCYATQDHNARVAFSADGMPMGSAFTRASGVRLAARVTDPDSGDDVTQIELFRGVTGVSSATLVATNSGSAEFSWRELETFAPGTEAHYYLRIRTSDNQSIWTGPVYVTYDPSSTVAVGDRPRAQGVTLAVEPNPSNGRQSVRFALPRAGRIRLEAFDAAGRHVHTLMEGEATAGEHHADWDGRTADGEAATPGLYFLRLETEMGAITRKLLRLK